MKKMHNHFFSYHKTIRLNTFQLLTLVYSCILLFVTCIACFFSSSQKRNEVESEINLTSQLLLKEYTDIVDNFWQIYMPIFESPGNEYIQAELLNYFVEYTDSELTPIQKISLSSSLRQMAIRDSQIQWIALYSEDREINYIYFTTGSSLQELTSSFPYNDLLENDSRMQIWQSEELSSNDGSCFTFAITGGLPINMGNGKIIVGYDISSFDQLFSSTEITLSSLSYRVTCNQKIIYDSQDNYSELTGFIPSEEAEESIFKDKGKSYIVYAKACGNKDSFISYSVLSSEIFYYSHTDTLFILFFVLLFYSLSMFLYSSFIKLISKEVNSIQNGLQIIGENNLDYTIATDFKQKGLPEIATSINKMTKQLKETIKLAYYYEIHQKNAELAELQSKFNPHFLYNSLEMLCSKCYQHGDDETAELINELASIFRGFIGSKTFIPLSEELNFSKKYLSLFGARYGDKVEVKYDIPTELLQYGIIRNCFQPIIENYFIHGFINNKENNYILFSGRIQEDNYIELLVEDNGIGMTEEAIELLNAKIHEPISSSAESYGLKNLHQRLNLFYGTNCGLSISSNHGNGLLIKMKITKLTCEEYEQKKLTTTP